MSIIRENYANKVVLVTGGTRGIGLACGLAFGRLGASVYLTHRWGSADEAEIARRFADTGAPAPTIVEADASRKADTTALLDRIAAAHDGIDVFVSNVCVVMKGEGVDSYKQRALAKALSYSSFPFVDYLHRAKERFGRYPKYAIATSSDGADSHYPHYDYVAIAKAVLETFVRYMATHLRNEGVRVNAVRTRQVVTESYREMFGDDMVALAGRFAEFSLGVDDVADVVVALCSGRLDTLNGQVIQVDRGASFVDNVFTMAGRLVER